jgi:3-methylcrotonyl-CoA carboxylase alpha subunit
LQQDQVRAQGHAFEARIYAEEPERDFMPAIGCIRHLALPAHVAFVTHAPAAAVGEPAPVRIDAAIRVGDCISPHYDAMIAKLIVWGADRDQALERLCTSLGQTQLVGLANNIGFLQRLAASAAFSNAQVDTGLIEREMAHLVTPDEPRPELAAAACARLLADEAHTQTSEPWSDRQGWRLNGVATRRLILRSGGTELEMTVEYRREGPQLVCGPWQAPLRIDGCQNDRLRLRLGDRALSADVVRDGEVLHVFADGTQRRFTLIDPIGHAGEADQDQDRLCAPMPGKVIAIHAAVGDRVRRGQPLLVLEAMKMEHAIVAPHDGTVEEVRYRIGDQVDEGATLVSLSDAEPV